MTYLVRVKFLFLLVAVATVLNGCGSSTSSDRFRMETLKKSIEQSTIDLAELRKHTDILLEKPDEQVLSSIRDMAYRIHTSLTEASRTMVPKNAQKMQDTAKDVSRVSMLCQDYATEQDEKIKDEIRDVLNHIERDLGDFHAAIEHHLQIDK